MPGVGEALLHADAALLQRVADLAGVGEVGPRQDLARQPGQPFDVFGQSRCACHERGRYGIGVVPVLIVYPPQKNEQLPSLPLASVSISAAECASVPNFPSTMPRTAA